ncbi:MAG: transglycosylase domain-containing protein [Firmicutes bacterium]|nr:transglycosylase domain-containing protein [Bacillota bacterium]
MTSASRRRRRRLAALVVVLTLTAALARTVAWLRELPSVKPALATVQESGSSIIYDAYGRVAVRLDPANSGFTPLHAVAPALVKAVIATEDRNFYHNPGFDVRALLRALWVDVRARRALEGASTITEQVAKNLYLSDQKTISRKIREFVLGLELAHTYSKRDILSLYLNTVYFGEGADGVGAAAKIYFNTTPARLTLPEASLLAGLPQAPSLYDPYDHWRRAKARQREVLAAMVRAGDITEAQAQRAWAAPLRLQTRQAQPGPVSYPYPWYVDAVVAQLLARGFSLHEIFDGRLHIDTALHPAVYRIAQRAVNAGMTANFGPPRHRYPYHQAAVVVENPKTGAIWAVIGGRRHFALLQEDLALDALRSTGSAIKPLLDYAPAIARGALPTTVMDDVPQFRGRQGNWWPHNDDYRYRGYLTLQDALAISDNNVAVRLLAATGVQRGLQFLRRRFDITPPPNEPQNLSLALGIDTNLLQLTQGYAALANHGQWVSPYFVRRVTQGSRILYQRRPLAHQALTPAQAYLMTSMLSRVLMAHPLHGIGPEAWPTGSSLGLNRPAAAKSGTSNLEADAWFIGYEPQMVVGVWEGNRTGESPQLFTRQGLGPAYGAVAAGPIWRAIMVHVNRALALPPIPFSRPPGLVYHRRISTTSGSLPGPATPAANIESGWGLAQAPEARPAHRWAWMKVAADAPDRRWRPGCGPFIARRVLQPEPDWRPHSPKPWDARFWPPTRLC